MNDKNKSYRTNKAAPEIDRVSTFTKGWYRSLTGKVDQLQTAIEGIKSRVESIKNNRYTEYQEMKAIPACYKRDFIVAPETQIITFDPSFYDANPRAFPNPYPVTNPSTTQPLNFVLRSGQTYDIDVQLPGDGVFVAKYLRVAIYQRHFRPNVGPLWMKIGIPEGRPYLNDANAAATLPVTAENQRFMVNVPDVQANPSRPNRKLEWFWNIIEKRSGRKYADDYLSGRFLLQQNPRYNNSVKDGDVFELDGVWTFERDSQFQFQFMPIMDVFQLSPTSPILPYGYDDRENNGLIRDSSIKIRVEVHGAKFLNMQDALKYGAVVDRPFMG